MAGKHHRDRLDGIRVGGFQLSDRAAGHTGFDE